MATLFETSLDNRATAFREALGSRVVFANEPEYDVVRAP